MCVVLLRMHEEYLMYANLSQCVSVCDDFEKNGIMLVHVCDCTSTG